MKHHYENIYVGEYNFFAIQALEQAFANPSKYLSLYLIGDWGYGKTTLLKAFKELVIAQNKTAVFYSVSKFMEDLLESIRNEKSSEFKKYLYEVDVLILDNIELLKDKSGTQSAWGIFKFSNLIVQQELSLLETVFQNEVVREIHEGRYHNGESAVIQYVGKK